MYKTILEKINGATCSDELFAISSECRSIFGVWSKEYDDLVGLCLNRFEQIYGVPYQFNNKGIKVQ